MSISEALEYTKRFQAWRTGKDERTMDEAGLQPANITKAIDTLIWFTELSVELAEKNIKK